MSRTLLLTATIQPPAGVPGLIRTDPTSRENDYVETLRQLAPLLRSGHFDRFVFSENSGADLSVLRRAAAAEGIDKQVDFDSFYGLDYPVVRGKAYGEFLLIQHAMETVPWLLNLGATDTVWKITGRYRVKNFPRLIASAPKQGFDFYIDLKDKPRPWADFRTFAFTREGYRRYFLPLIPVVSGDTERFIGEEAARPFFQQFVGTPGFVPRFRSEPLVQGVRGFDGRDYADFKTRYKFLIRSVARKISPGYWI